MLSQRMLPPCLSVIAFAMASPSPLPVGEPGVRAEETVKVRLKSFGMASGGMPIPLSVTEMDSRGGLLLLIFPEKHGKQSGCPGQNIFPHLSSGFPEPG